MLQIVLVGQEELGTRIMQYRELASRMFPIAMNAMSPDDLKEMILFRLTVAGHHGSLFDEKDEAYKTLYTYTKGLSRDALTSLDTKLAQPVTLPEKVDVVQPTNKPVCQFACKQVNLQACKLANR